MTKVLRTAAVAELLGISRGTLWRWHREGHFPPPRQLGQGKQRPICGWLESDVLKWLNSRPTVSEAEL